MPGIVTKKLASGLVVILEEITGVSSAALHWALPCGAATDEAHLQGTSAMIAEMLLRGAGSRTSREHSDALDRLGVQRATSVRVHHVGIEAALAGSALEGALPLFVDMVRAPRFPDEAVEPVRNLCLQSLEGLDDEPQQRVMLRARERHIASPFNRHGYGTAVGLNATSGEQLRGFWRRYGVAGGSLLGIAGAINANRVLAQLDELLLGWGGEAVEPEKQAIPLCGYEHIEQQTAQVHIAMAWDAPKEADRQSMLERLAVAVLSGSTSGRLFTEVRQRRSLCYSVGATYRAGRDAGVVNLYAGTTPERAQQTLDVCAQEILRMEAGVTRAEFQRAVIGLKSHLVMQGESTTARAAALTYDMFRLGRARTLEEICQEIDSISLDQLNAYVLARAKPRFTVVSIGPESLYPPTTNVSPSTN